MRIVFAGTPEFSAAHLQALIDSTHQLVGVYTQPDRRAGRGKAMTASPVKQLAEAHSLPVFQPLSLKDEDAQKSLQQLNADVMVVVAYGLLLPQAVLDIPRFGCLNVHASLLPRWRGAAPIQRAIEAGDTHTGVTIMQMDAGLDTGDMLRKEVCDISPSETGGSLHDKLMSLGAPALLATLEDMEKGRLDPVAQDDDGACYASKLSKAEAQLIWSRDSSELHNQIRAFNPFPVCYFTMDDQTIRVWESCLGSHSGISAAGTVISADEQGIEVSCGEGSLILKSIQLPGKKAQPIQAILNGYKDRFLPGTVL